MNTFSAMNIWLAIFKRWPHVDVGVGYYRMFTFPTSAYAPPKGSGYIERNVRPGFCTIFDLDDRVCADRPLAEMVSGDLTELRL